jgi:hypothetical protein
MITIQSVREWGTFFIVFWAFGYLASRLASEERIVMLPRWLFYLCGAPRSRRLPEGALTRLGALFQIFALLLLLLGTVMDAFFTNHGLGGLIAICVSVFCTWLIMWFLIRDH